MTTAPKAKRYQVNWQQTALILILVIGAFLRFYGLGDIEFNVDQIYPIWQALNTIETGDLPLAGQGTSVLFDNPPMTGYLLLPFMLLTRLALVAFIVTITLNTFAIWLTYRALLQLVGPHPALVGTALFAFNPWIIEDSRRTWVQSLMPFFVCLIFWALVPVLLQQTRHPKRRLLIGLVGLAVFANTYLLSYALTAPVGLLLLIFWKRIPKQTLFIGAGVFLLLFALYAIGLASQWDETRHKTDEFLTGGSRLTDEALSHAIRLVTGHEYAVARGTDAPADDAQRRADISQFIHWFWLVALVLGVGKALYYLVAQQPTKLPRAAALILLVWFLLPVIMMSYVSRSVHPFYLLLSVPAGHGLAAWALAPLLQIATSQRAIISMLILTGLFNGLNAIRFPQETAATPGAHIPYTLSLESSINFGNDIREAFKDGMTVYTPADVWAPMVMAGDIFPVVQIGDVEQMTVIPRQGGLYTLYHGPNEGLTPPMHGKITTVPLRLVDGTRLTVWEVQQERFNPPHRTDKPSDIGVRFIGWDLSEALRPGNIIHLRTYWQVDSLHPERGQWTFAPYAHLFTGNGQKIISDGVLVPSGTWDVGDWMIQELSIEVPPDSIGPYSINIGLYDSVRQTNASFYFPSADGETIWTIDIALWEN